MYFTFHNVSLSLKLVLNDALQIFWMKLKNGLTQNVIYELTKWARVSPRHDSPILVDIVPMQLSLFNLILNVSLQS